MQVEAQDVERVIAVARAAGILAEEMRRAGLGAIKGKSNETDLVTAADIACEQYIREALWAHYPGLDLLGEESGQQPASEYYWIVDPIDGTVNYATGLPYSSVTIALHRGRETLLGVTCQHESGLVYHSRLGHGAFVRRPDGSDERLSVNGAARLIDVLTATGFPYHAKESPDDNLAEIGYFLSRVRAVRVLGSAALDLCHVATGALGAFWEGWLNPWDAAAGVLFVREAGGRVTDYAGNEWRIGSWGVVASNGQPAIHDGLLAGIRQARATLTELKMPALP
jgi:myo-inositol-1(or 4)-monophosphatase